MDIYKKLLEVQKEIKPIVKDSVNPHFKNKYFDINTLLAEVKPVLNKHGLLLIQAVSMEFGKNALVTKIVDTEDKSDGMISYSALLPDVADAQKLGGAISYLRRYSLQAILALEAEDDDANAVSGVKASSGAAQSVTDPKIKASKDRITMLLNSLGRDTSSKNAVELAVKALAGIPLVPENYEEIGNRLQLKVDDMDPIAK